MAASRDLFDGLLERGFSESQAYGIMANFSAESGFDAGINEQNPTVEGSRGGYGLYQLTGPRRTAYEGYANETGKRLDDPTAQLDFMMNEFAGPERAAYRSVKASGTPEEAARAFSKDFLRPGHDNTSYRMSMAENMAKTGNFGAAGRFANRQRELSTDLQNDIINARGEADHYGESAARLFMTPEELERAMAVPEFEPTGGNTMQGVFDPMKLPYRTASLSDVMPPPDGPPVPRAAQNMNPPLPYGQMPAESRNPPLPYGQMPAQNMNPPLPPGNMPSLGMQGPQLTRPQARPEFQGPQLTRPQARPVAAPTTANPTPRPDEAAVTKTSTAGSPERGGDKKDKKDRKVDVWAGLEGLGLGLSQISANQTADIGKVFQRRAATDQGQQTLDQNAVAEQRLQRTQNLAAVKLARTEAGRNAVATEWLRRNPGQEEQARNISLSEDLAAQAAQFMYDTGGGSGGSGGSGAEAYQTRASREVLAAAAAENPQYQSDAQQKLILESADYAAEVAEQLPKRFASQQSEHRQLNPEQASAAYTMMNDEVSALANDDPRKAEADRMLRRMGAEQINGTPQSVGDVFGQYLAFMNKTGETEAEANIELGADSTLAKLRGEIEQEVTGARLDQTQANAIDLLELNTEAKQEAFKNQVATDIAAKSVEYKRALTKDEKKAVLDKSIATHSAGLAAEKDAVKVDTNNAYLDAIGSDDPALRGLAGSPDTTPLKLSEAINDAAAVEYAQAQDARAIEQNGAVSARFTERGEELLAEGNTVASEIYKTAAIYARNGNVVEAAKAILQLDKDDRPSEMRLAEWYADAGPKSKEALAELRRLNTGNTAEDHISAINAGILTTEAERVPALDNLSHTFEAAHRLVSQHDFKSGVMTQALLPIGTLFKELGINMPFNANMTETQLFDGLMNGLIQHYRVEGSGPMSDWDGKKIESAIAGLGKTPDANRALVQYHLRRTALDKSNIAAKRDYYIGGGDMQDTAAMDEFMANKAEERGLHSEPFYTVGGDTDEQQTANMNALVAAGKLEEGDMMYVNGKLISYWSE